MVRPYRRALKASYLMRKKSCQVPLDGDPSDRHQERKGPVRPNMVISNIIGPIRQRCFLVGISLMQLRGTLPRIYLHE